MTGNYNMKRKFKSVLCVLSMFLLLTISAYVNTYYHASQEAVKAIENAEYMSEDSLVFLPDSDSKSVKCGLIFYPGGKVEYTAYASLMEACAKEGILCVLLKMPCNLAVLDMNAADGIQELFPEIKNWYMAGHSLGGSMAASYIGDNSEDYKGLILLAAYSTEDLSSTDLKVLSIYGTEDQVLNREKYLEYEDNLPKDYKEEEIEGGCHAYFGNYGEQEGDGEAGITPEEQQNLTVEAIKSFLQ